MPNIKEYENLVLGSGVAGRLLTWTPGECRRPHRHRGARTVRRSMPERCLPAEQGHHPLRQSRRLRQAERRVRNQIQFDERRYGDGSAT